MTQLEQARSLCISVGKNKHHAECLFMYINDNFDFKNSLKTENFGYFEWLMVETVRSAMRRKNKPQKRRR